MGWFLMVLLMLAMLASPFFVADSRDGRDWQPSELSRGGDRAVARGASKSPGARWVRSRWSRLTRSRRSAHQPTSCFRAQPGQYRAATPTRRRPVLEESLRR